MPRNQHLRLDSGWDWVPSVFCSKYLRTQFVGKKHTFSNVSFSEESGKVQTLPTVQGTSYTELHRVLPSSVRRTNLGRSSSTNYFNQSLRVESPQLLFDPLSCFLTPCGLQCTREVFANLASGKSQKVSHWLNVSKKDIHQSWSLEKLGPLSN